MQKMLQINDENAMEKLGSALYKMAPIGGMVILLAGELGAGKTTLVRGFLRGMKYSGSVKSPTYTLVEPYEIGQTQVFHFDFYRLNDPQELEYMGIRDYFNQDNYCLIEWPQKAKGTLPQGDLSIDIQINNTSRNVSISALSDKGKNALQRLSYD